MEVDSVGLVIGILVWLTVASTLAGLALWARKTAKVQGDLIQARINAIELKAWGKVDEMASRYEDKLEAMMAEARPWLLKAGKALDGIEPALGQLQNIEAFPATMVEGLKPVLHDFMLAEVKPLAQSFMDGVTGQLNEALGRVEGGLAKIVPVLAPTLAAGNKAFSRMGVDAREDKAAGREIIEGYLAQAGPLRSLIEKNVKTAKGSDPMAFVNELVQWKGFITTAFPQYGPQIDALIARFLGLEAGGGQGAGVGNILGLVTGGNGSATPSEGVEGYGR